VRSRSVSTLPERFEDERVEKKESEGESGHEDGECWPSSKPFDPLRKVAPAALADDRCILDLIRAKRTCLHVRRSSRVAHRRDLR
jgi:hypothetical protein